MRRTFYCPKPTRRFSMNDSERCGTMFYSDGAFGTDNSAISRPSRRGDEFWRDNDPRSSFSTIKDDQQAGFGDARGATETKGTARENLREEMSDISRTARSMEYAFDGISDRFRMPRGSSDQLLLATGRAFHSEATPIAADFIAYGMPATFLTELAAEADAFEATFGVQGSAIDSHVEATAEIGESVQRGMVARRILDGVVRNVYKNDPGKLAAWTSASHIEKPPKKTETPTP